MAADSRSIRATGVVTVAGAIDREADGASRNITVRSTSSDGSFTTAVFAIGVDDVDEFDVTVPIDSDATANFVNENSSPRHDRGTDRVCQRCRRHRQCDVFAG